MVIGIQTGDAGQVVAGEQGDALVGSQSGIEQGGALVGDRDVSHHGRSAVAPQRP